MYGFKRPSRATWDELWQKASVSSSKTIDNLSSKIKDFKFEVNQQRDIEECIASHTNELDEIEKEHNSNQQWIEMLKKEIADLEA